MKKSLILTFFILVGKLCSAQLVISEISYNPPESGNDSLEYLEIYNASSSTYNLKGASIKDAFVYEFGDTSIASGKYMVLCINPSAMMNVFGISPIKWTTGALSNSGEIATLLAADGSVLDSVRFATSGAWPGSTQGTNGGGASIELCDLTSDNNAGTNWGASKKSIGIIINNRVVYGTPGAANQCMAIPAATVQSLGTRTFSPKNTTIKVGETVKFQNVAGDHNVNGKIEKYPNNPESFYSGESSSSQWIYEYTFTKPGVYQFVCDPHELDNMTGTITVVQSGLTGSEEIFIPQAELSVYPNPASNFIQVNADSELERIAIYSTSGSLMIYESIRNNQQIDISRLGSGNYVIKVTLANGLLGSKIIVKQ